MSTPYSLPLKIHKVCESIQIVDARGRAIYLYVEEAELRRFEMKRWTEAEATEIARIIARALTGAAG
ncbi:hypothetical protein [Bosea sp. (in: a-proteobacteria)]|uniref:hypothetical protein n=1 Tax=Bosea sp. (in: a-proteobacteria) TaxID=1871050 RepID=UPI003B3B825E